MTYAELTHGLCITCKYNDNFVAGRILRVQGNAYLCNNDYAKEVTITTTQDDRFGYRLILPMWGRLGEISNKITNIKIKTLAELPYKKGDKLTNENNEIWKVAGRSGEVHFLELQNETAEIYMATRKMLNQNNFSLYENE